MDVLCCVDRKDEKRDEGIGKEGKRYGRMWKRRLHDEEGEKCDVDGIEGLISCVVKIGNGEWTAKE